MSMRWWKETHQRGKYVCPGTVGQVKQSESHLKSFLRRALIEDKGKILKLPEKRRINRWVCLTHTTVHLLLESAWTKR